MEEQDNKKNREVKKAARQVKKDDRVKAIESDVDKRISNTVQPKGAEPSKDVNLDIKVERPDNWGEMTSSQKNKWDVDNKTKVISRNVSKNIGDLHKKYAPTKERLPEIDRDKLIDIEKKIKKRKWLDIVSGVLTGAQGKEVDRSQLPTGILKAEREKMYQDYKDVVDRNRGTSNTWKGKEFESRINFLQDSFKKAKTPEEKQMFEQEMKLERDKFMSQEGFKKQEMANDKRKLDMMEAGTYGSTTRRNVPTAEDLAKDPEYKLKERNAILKERELNGKEAAVKLENTLNGYKADITNLNNKKYELQAAKGELGYGNKAEKAEYDKQIAEIDQKIADTNQNIADAFKGVVPAKKDKLDEFFN